MRSSAIKTHFAMAPERALCSTIGKELRFSNGIDPPTRRLCAFIAGKVAHSLGTMETDHAARHKQLHQALDELVADWIKHTDGRPNTGRVIDLITWSHAQTLSPTERKDGA